MSPLRASPSRRLLWFGVVGAPLAWAVQEWAGWYLSSAPCAPHRAAYAILDSSRWWLAGVDVLVLLVGVAALLAGLRGRARTHASPEEAMQLDRFLATVAVIVSAVGLLALAWGSLGTFFLDTCEAVR